MPVKYVFVTGGVVSGLGKGITAASLGRLLKARGYEVRNQKFDPYLNVDPATMSPYQHGEVFVTDDGAEGDLDIGHYERFIDENLNVDSDITTGKIYKSVILKERHGDYGGRTVQVIPHITNEIKECVYRVAKETDADFVITEIGGTVGDIEGLPFLEAIRQIMKDVGRSNCMYIHVALVPYISGSGELKTKPTQHSAKKLLSLGIQPDVIVCRCESEMPKDVREKIALFCNIEPDCVILNPTADTLYEVPLLLEKEGLAQVVLKRLNLPPTKPDLTEWAAMVEKIKTAKKCVKVAIAGKYNELHDACLSVAEALFHGGIANGVSVDIEWVPSEGLTDENAAKKFRGCQGIVVPGAIGDGGIEGKLVALKYARENDIPMFALGEGMQLAVIEFARNAAGIPDANSAEFDPDTKSPLYIKGEGMKLGLYACLLKPGTKAHEAYFSNRIQERHRHLYELDFSYKDKLEAAGMVFSGLAPDGKYADIAELPKKRWYVATQFHPEFKSRPNRPHPLFKSFIKVCAE
ncbi:MAG: CTP synthase [Clostridia bacterium]|nr:CTP synthase [Clostridia bacterium]